MRQLYPCFLAVLLCLFVAAPSAFAQFPNPYCNVLFTDGVEPITRVMFANVNNTSPATPGASGGGNDLQNFTAISVNVQKGLLYQISVEGNTAGNYTDGVAVYIDWNNDGDFNDAGEGFGVGVLTNSTGLDAKRATSSILIPENVTTGAKRMRFIKLYGAYAPPCNTPAPNAGDNYGQAEDYTLTVADAPPCLPVYGVRVTATTNNSASIVWNAVTNAGAYEYAVTTSATPPVSGTQTATTTVTPNGLAASTQYYFHVRANCGGNGTSANWSTLAFRTLCDPATLPYTEDLNAASPAAPAPPDCIAVENANFDGFSWATGNGNGTTLPSKYIRYIFNPDNAANDWFFTRGLNLTAGDTYQLTFKYKASDGPAFVEKLEVKFGTAAGVAAMTSPAIFSNENINSKLADPYTTATIDFTVPATGAYYLGFHVFSAADQGFLYVDDVSVVKTGSLPVTLTSFSGESVGQKNVLHWKTAAEINNKGFELQRSTDGTAFSTIGFVASKSNDGHSNTTLHYLFEDGRPFGSDNYYRLRQVDKDGKFSLSGVVLLKGATSSRLAISTLYPNPVRSSLQLVVSSPSANKINLLVTDLMGRVVLQQPAAVLSGSNMLRIEVPTLPAGSYLIKAVCASGCETAVQKFIKQ